MAANATVAVGQSSGQRGDDFARAAARILAELIANFVGRFPANSLVAVVQTVDERSHDFRVADAAILVAQFVESTTAILGIAGGLRLVDQARDLAGVIFAAGFATAAIGIVAARIRVVAASVRSRSRTARTTGCGSAARLGTARSRAVRGAVVGTSSRSRTGRSTSRGSGARRSALRTTRSRTVRSTVVRTGRCGSRTGRSARSRSRTRWGTGCGSSTSRSALRAARSGTVRSTVVAAGIAWSSAARIATLLAAAGGVMATAAWLAARIAERRARSLIRVDRRATRPSDHWFAARGLAGRCAAA